MERVRRIGVADASVASFAPLTGSEDVYPVEGGANPIPFKFFTPGYFQMTGTPIFEGQSFTSADRESECSPVLVSAALARRLFPNQSAVGKAVRRLNADGTMVEMGPTIGPVPPFTIVGVVGDARESSLRDGPTEIVYVPLVEPPVERLIVTTYVTLLVRTRVPSMSLAADVRAAIARVDPSLSLGRVQPLDAIVGKAMAKETFVRGAAVAGCGRSTAARHGGRVWRRRPVAEAPNPGDWHSSSTVRAGLRSSGESRPVRCARSLSARSSVSSRPSSERGRCTRSSSVSSLAIH